MNNAIDMSLIIGAFIGGFLSIIGILINFILTKICDDKKRRKWFAIYIRKFTWICLIIFAIDLSAFVIKKTTEPPTKQPEALVTLHPDSTDIKIIYPKDMDSVSSIDTIRGRYQNIPKGYRIWLIISPGSGFYEYYPQLGTDLIIKKNNNWETKATFGIESSVFVKFTLIAVLANEFAVRKFIIYNQQAQAIERETGEWPPIDSLPNGLRFYDRIVVIRK